MKMSFRFASFSALSVTLFLVSPLGWSQESEASKKSKGNRTIVIQESQDKLLQAPEVFVESGSDTVSGSPESHIKAAYRTWQTACKEWEAKLKSYNGNNLMMASCGDAQRTEESIQSEKIYTYKSKATYKIRVLGK